MPDFVHNLEYMLSVIPAPEHESLKKRVAWALSQGWTDIGLWTDFGKSPNELDLAGIPPRFFDEAGFAGIPPRGRVQFAPVQTEEEQSIQAGSKVMIE